MKRWLEAEISRAPRAYATLFLAVLALGAYWNSLDGGFHFDDGHHVVRNPYVRDIAYSKEFFHRPDMFSAVPGHNMYRPLLMVTFAFNYWIDGYNPLAWRLTSVALHALTAIGVMFAFLLLLQRFKAPPSLAAAVAAGALFALHPVMTESVNYASARSSVLATCLAVWAFCCHVRSLEAREGRPRVAWMVASCLLLAGSLLSKEIGAVFPLLVLSLAILDRRNVFAAVVPSVVVVCVCLLVRDIVLGEAVIDFSDRAAKVATADTGTGAARTVMANLYTQARVIGAYVFLFLWPFDLCVYRDVRVSHTPWDAAVLAGAVVMLSMLWAAWRLRRDRPEASLGLVWFFVALAPTSSLIPLNQVMNEHRLYWPGVGIAFVVAALVRGRRAAVPWAVAAACVACAVTVHRNEAWHDSLSLWQSAARTSPDSEGAWNGVGVELRSRGDYVGAQEAFLYALTVNPEYWPSILNQGKLHLDRGRARDNHADLLEAERWFQRALEAHPKAETARWSLAEAHYALGRVERAERGFGALAGLNPRLFEMTRYPLAQIAIDRGDFEAAADFYDEALRHGVDPVGAHLGIARLEMQRNNRTAAMAAVERAKDARPHSPDPYIYLAKVHKGTPAAVSYLFEAASRGHKLTPEQRRELVTPSRR